MSLAKRIIKSNSISSLLCWLGAQYIRLVYLSGRWTVVRGDIPRAYGDEGKPFILCFWHGRLLMAPYYRWGRSKIDFLLLSQHRDGQIGSCVVKRFGIRSVFGSSSKGGVVALRVMLRVLKSGQSVGIAPDGPQGPCMQASLGIVNLARLSGAPIIPATYSAVRGKVLKSWDRFFAALPFGRGAIVWGEPIYVPRNADDETLEAARLEVQRALNTITKEADCLCSRPPIKPESEAVP